MRDHWWHQMEEREANLTGNPLLEKLAEILEDSSRQEALRSRGVVIYHRVFENEDFVTASTQIYELVRGTQRQFPNRRRVFYIEIDGHLNEEGGWDHDMWELQRYFLLGFMGQFLSEVHTPCWSVTNKRCQRNDLSERLEIMTRISGETLRKAIDSGMSGIWLAERDRWISLGDT